jgi:hypothetical protein
MKKSIHVYINVPTTGVKKKIFLGHRWLEERSHDLSVIYLIQAKQIFSELNAVIHQKTQNIK